MRAEKQISMLNRIQSLVEEVNALKAQTVEEAEALRIKYLSKKGAISALFDEFKQVAPELKREVGQKLNQLKNNMLQKQ